VLEDVLVSWECLARTDAREPEVFQEREGWMVSTVFLVTKVFVVYLVYRLLVRFHEAHQEIMVSRVHLVQGDKRVELDTEELMD